MTWIISRNSYKNIFYRLSVSVETNSSIPILSQKFREINIFTKSFDLIKKLRRIAENFFLFHIAISKVLVNFQNFHTLCITQTDEITEIFSHTFLTKISWKQLKSWFHEKIVWWETRRCGNFGNQLSSHEFLANISWKQRVN